jgi:hypothetical protein
VAIESLELELKAMFEKCSQQASELAALRSQNQRLQEESGELTQTVKTLEDDKEALEKEVLSLRAILGPQVRESQASLLILCLSILRRRRRDPLLPRRPQFHPPLAALFLRSLCQLPSLKIGHLLLRRRALQAARFHSRLQLLAWPSAQRRFCPLVPHLQRRSRPPLAILRRLNRQHLSIVLLYLPRLALHLSLALPRQRLSLCPRVPRLRHQPTPAILRPLHRHLLSTVLPHLPPRAHRCSMFRARLPL